MGKFEDLKDFYILKIETKYNTVIFSNTIEYLVTFQLDGKVYQYRTISTINNKFTDDDLIEQIKEDINGQKKIHRNT
jgi:hypothetical protein